ncbi:MAG: expansin EXLX1 family cellulose-binding protein [Dokdonella sp.]
MPRRAIALWPVALILFGVTSAACPPVFQSSGDATYYSADGSGACSYPVDTSDVLIAAINAPQWSGSAHCGECLLVTGPLGTVTVRIVDECPECAAGDLDLHPTAFAQIAHVIDGRVPVSWTRVDCPETGHVINRVDAGSNPYYIGLVADHHRQGVSAMSINVGNAWYAMARQDYNRFLWTGGGAVNPPFQVRITSNAGESIDHTVTNLDSGSVFDTGQQFSACTDDVIFAYGFETGS